MQVHGSFKTIAAIVTWTACHPYAMGVRRKGHGKPGNCQPCALHQRVRWQRIGGKLFDAAGSRNVKKWLAVRRSDLLHRSQSEGLKAVFICPLEYAAPAQGKFCPGASASVYWLQKSADTCWAFRKTLC